MGLFACLVTTLLEVVYPERCFLCGAGPGEKPWFLPGGQVPGLRFWDTTNLCRACAAGLKTAPVTGSVGSGHAGCLEVAAACHTHPDLVKLVGGFKYHGLRGLAWPLARQLREPLALARASAPVDALVPVPLSRRRRRVRGFNQAEILGRILSRESGLPLLDGVLARHRNTSQQAKIDSPELRRQNLVGSYRARPPIRGLGASGAEIRRVGLVDDLVTSGWTTVTAAAAMRAAGWQVSWVLGLGLAAKSRNCTRKVDTWRDGF